MRSFLNFCLLCVVAAAPSTNPVEDYQHVFAQLESLAASEKTLLGNYDIVPLDEPTSKFLQNHKRIIDLLRVAAAKPQAIWPDPAGDMNKILPALNTARSAAQLLWLQSRADDVDH